LLRQGKPLAEAIEESGFPASRPLLAILKSSEQKPQLEALLENVGQGYEEEAGLKRSLREALVYPFCILFIMTICIVVYCFTVVEAMYLQGWEATPPVLFWLYSVFHAFRPLWLFLLPASLFVAYWFLEDPFRIPIPGIKKVSLETRRALFCQLMHREISCNRTIVQALQTGAESFPGDADELRLAIERSRDGLEIDVVPGNLFTAQLKFFLNRAGTAEALIPSIARLKDFHRDQAQYYSLSLQKRVEIWMIVTLGLLVGFVLIQSFGFYYGYIIGKLPF